MSDFICKRELYHKLGEAYNKGYLSWGANEIIKDIIGKCDSVENKGEWIPVSERLPEKNVWVLVTVEQSGKRFQEIMRRNNYIEAWTDNIDNYTDEITAWMPLPEPYKEEKPETCKGCLEPCIMYEPDMRGCKKKG